jgi:hypothetical protein
MEGLSAYTQPSQRQAHPRTLAGLIMTCVIDVFERRDVATADLPGAFLQTKMSDDEPDAHVMLEGRMAEPLAKISPETYQKYIHNRGQAMIYCRLKVSLYGTLNAAKADQVPNRGWIQGEPIRLV